MMNDDGGGGSLDWIDAATTQEDRSVTKQEEKSPKLFYNYTM
jgi:hypothetical protein